ncbi:MAG: helix-turn-helix transcriptional regulator [Bacteroidales bacterium]|nr:helix-turn-helix transcriptional regulator [Bacteroidales bacterium]
MKKLFKMTLIIEKWIHEKHWAEDLTAQEIADELGFRKEEFCSYFRRVHGKTFLQWRKEMRINEAKRLLLKDKTIPTAIIGEAVGINDRSNFKRWFRELAGCTPAQWRLKH